MKPGSIVPPALLPSFQSALERQLVIPEETILLEMMRMCLAGLGLGLSVASYHALYQRPVRLDGPIALSADPHGRMTPAPGRWRSQLNPGTVREISSGSIIGMDPRWPRQRNGRVALAAHIYMC